jgi:hypothetical protein
MSKEDNEKIGKLLKQASLDNNSNKEEEIKKAFSLIKGLSLSKKERELQEKKKVSKFLREFLEREEENKKNQEEENKKAFSLIKGLSLSKKERDLQEKERELQEKKKVSKFLREFLEREEENKKNNKKIGSLLKQASLDNNSNKEEESKKAFSLIKGLSLSKKERELQEKERELQEKKKVSKFLREFLEREEENKKNQEEENKKALSLIKGLSLSKKERELQEKKKVSKFLKILKKSQIYKSSQNESTPLKGTNIGAPIVPGSDRDSYPTHDEKYGLGGYRSVEDAQERDSIPLERRKEGMIVRTNSDGREWVLLNDLETWSLNLIGIESVDALEQHLNFKVDSYDSKLYGKVDVNGELNTVFLNTNGHFNTGVILGESFSTGKICIKTKILDFTINDNTVVFVVPSGFMFMIDSIEVITTKIVSPRNSPHVRFGINGQNSTLIGSKKMNINTDGARHIIEYPQQGLLPGTSVTMGVSEVSTATHHQGVGLVNGFLLKLSDQNYLEVPPLSGVGFTNCENTIATVISCNKSTEDWIREIEDLGYSNVRSEEKHSEFCSSCKDVTFFGSCCENCDSLTKITYEDCKGETFIELPCCENEN